MKIIVKEFVKNVFNLIGYNITPGRKNALIHQKIDILFDVGANTGQYALDARRQGYQGKIISFEPLPEAYKKLVKKSKKDPLWIIHKRIALGEKKASRMINVSENSYSSSFLNITKKLISNTPNTKYIKKVSANIVTLDSVFNLYVKKSERVFLKIDTQGFESEVLKGSIKNLKNICGIQLELSTEPLYQKQKTYEYFLTFLKKNNYHLWSIIPGYWNTKTGQMLQFDGIFINKGNLSF
jgi:FkbM family methyltransferase